MGRKASDITGERFGMLVARKRVGTDKYGYPLWLCDCDCGYKGHIVSISHLRDGGTQSCTCLRTKKSGERLKELHKKRASIKEAKCKYSIRL